MSTDTKRCSGCSEPKPLSEFYLRGSGRKPGERQSRCKGCMAKAQYTHREHHRKVNGFGSIDRYRLKHPVRYASSCLLTAAKHIQKGDLRRARWYLDRAGASLQFAKQTGIITPWPTLPLAGQSTPST
jgi:hypothetical protein